MIRDRSDIPEPKFDELVAQLGSEYKRVFVGKTTFKENLGFDNYYGEMYIGPTNAPIKFALDTKAENMVVKLGNCKGCTGSGKYDAYMNERTHFNEENEEFKPVTYGYNTDIIGNLISGNICLNEDYCLPNFTFMRGLSQKTDPKDEKFETPIYTYGAMVPLAPNSQILKDDNYKGFDLGLNPNQISFYLSDTKDHYDVREGVETQTDSFLEFGQYNAEEFKCTEDEIAWVPAIQYGEALWKNEIRGIKIGGKGFIDDLAFATEYKMAESNTGVQCIEGPKKYIDFLRAALKDSLMYSFEDEEYDWGVVWRHSEINMDQLPSIYFLFGDYWFEVTPYMYSMQVSEITHSFCLSYSHDDTW